MKQDKIENKEQIYKSEEIEKMFNESFLPVLEMVARRVQEKLYKDKEIICFETNMRFQFDKRDFPLTYESLQTKIDMKLIPLFEEDLQKREAADVLEK